MDTTDDDIIQPRTLLFVELRRENLEMQEKQREIMNLSLSLKNTSAPGRVTKEIQNAAQTLQNLQSLSAEKIGDILPPNSTKYSIDRLVTRDKFERKNLAQTCGPDIALRTRFFEVGGNQIPYPSNKKQYTAIELCKFFDGYEGNKKDVIKIMLQKELLPVKSINPVYELLRGYKLNKNIAWKKIGRPAIFSDQQLHKRVKLHEHDVARACSKNDMKTFLKEEKMKKATDQARSVVNYCKFPRS